MKDSLDGKVVILTGASSGIGKALAIALARQGASLVLAARRADKLHAVAGDCRDLGAKVLVQPTDVADMEACKSLVDATIDKFGRVDVLINNAGIMMWSRLDETDDLATADKVMRVNYLGSVYCTRYALPHLKKTGGRVVAIISLAGITGVPTRSFYSASKHAMTGFFDSIRIELKEDGVSVTSIFPGFVAIEDRGRALSGDGKAIGKSPVDESKAMTAKECAEIIVEATASRRREVIMHPTGRWGQVIKAIAPGLIDLLAMRTLKKYKS
mgnify:FL=1